MAKSEVKLVGTPTPATEKTPGKKRAKRGPKRPWRQRLTLTSILMTVVLVSILGAGGMSGYYALRVLYENKLTDTWAILFLQLERQGDHISDQLEHFAGALGENGEPSTSASSARSDRPPDGLVRIAPNGDLTVVRGAFPLSTSLADFNLKAPESAPPLSTTDSQGAANLTASPLKDRWNVLQFAGENYLGLFETETSIGRILGETLPTGSYLALWKINLAGWFAGALEDSARNTMYLVTKEGKVAFTNDPDVTPTGFQNRPLVQKFVASPVREGQFEFEGSDGPSYGFFYEIPRTNLVLFVETTKKVALAGVHEVAVRFVVVLLIILLGAALLLQYPLSSLISPMRELVRLAHQVGDGNFHIKPKRRGFGELNLLTQSFADMANSLVVREDRINLLLIEQKEKFRLADELAIAQSIQDNFLLKSPLPKQSGLEVAAQYSPAAECAGDWYGYFYDEVSDESVFAIADVSGHGAGSAMFTAIIAATFEEMRTEKFDPFPLGLFAVRLNHLLLKLGRGNWHATLLAARHKKGSGEMEILNAGHPFPLLISDESKGVKPEPVPIRSDFLGVKEDFAPAVKSVSFLPGTSLLMYTDGLIEGRPDLKPYGQRRLVKTCQIGAHQSMAQLVNKVFSDWTIHLDGKPPLDDLCLLAVRAA